MKAQKEKFTQGCVKGGMKKEIVQQLWEQIETFAAYGFNKAHAASYGNLAYKTAYMKANFPVDYMAALLTAEAGDVEKIAEVVTECKRMGIKVWPPSVNESYGNFTVVDDTNIRFGLYSIKNFGTGVADSIIAARDLPAQAGKAGPFTDIANFLTRISDKNLNKKSLESLIECGAFDDMGLSRGELLANLETLLEYHRETLNAPQDQSSLFGALSAPRVSLSLHKAQPVPLEVLLGWEKELLGLYVSGHPLDKHKSKFDDPKKSIRHAKENLRGVECVIAGFVENARINTTKNGERMGFLKLMDFSDGIEIVAFPRTFKEYETIMAPGSCIAVKGRISDRNGETSFVVERAKAL
jgi:DNA polymerase-3 subunit alpha